MFFAENAQNLGKTGSFVKMRRVSKYANMLYLHGSYSWSSLCEWTWCGSRYDVRKLLTYLVFNTKWHPPIASEIAFAVFNKSRFLTEIKKRNRILNSPSMTLRENFCDVAHLTTLQNAQTVPKTFRLISGMIRMILKNINNFWSVPLRINDVKLTYLQTKIGPTNLLK